MKTFRRLITVILAGLCMGKSAIASYASGYSYKCMEVCDGEVIEMEPLDYTFFVFPDRTHDDLANKVKRTREDMKILVDHVLKLHPSSAFKGMEQAFISASNATGLDPIFFFSLAGIESAWGTNETHVLLNNPYSIGMFGDGVHKGWKFEGSFGDAIVEGAKFIYDTYYKNGQITLYLMNHDARGHCYCDGDSSWEFQIASEMNYLEELLKKGE